MDRLKVPQNPLLPLPRRSVPRSSHTEPLHESRFSKRRKQMWEVVEEVVEWRHSVTRPTLEEEPHQVDQKLYRVISDERMRIRGGEAFLHFQSRFHELVRVLERFRNAVRRLGSSAGLLSSASRLHNRLQRVLTIFQANATELFPTKLQKRAPPNAEYIGHFKRKKHPSSGKNDLEHLPEQLKKLANDFGTFLTCINEVEFPEFTNTSVNEAVTALKGDLEYYASCLEVYKAKLRSTHVQSSVDVSILAETHFTSIKQYAHEVSIVIGERVENVTSNLTDFVKNGIPTINAGQQAKAADLLSLSAMATFVSAVTATTAQFSFERNEQHIDVAVNVFWFGSIVLSSASAVNNLLGILWLGKLYRSPKHKVPWIVTIWLRKSPLILLILSVSLFSAGLICFCFATQPKVVSLCVLTLSVFSSFGLAAILGWLLLEKWTYSEHKGALWPIDIIKEFCERFRKFFTFYLNKAIPSGWRTKLALPASRLKSFVPSMINRTAQRDSHLALPTVTIQSHEDGRLRPQPSAHQSKGTMEGVPNSPTRLKFILPRVPPQSDEAVATPAPLSPRIHRSIRNLVQRIRSSPRGVTPTQVQQFKIETANPKPDLANSEEDLSIASEQSDRRPLRIPELIPALHTLSKQSTLTEHQAPVGHLQFSPDGKWLATCSWDQTIRIWKIPASVKPQDKLSSPSHPLHASGFIEQVAWSPDSELILTKTTHVVTVWTKSGVCKKQIERTAKVQAVAWLPRSQDFLTIEGSLVYCFDLNGKTRGYHSLNSLDIQALAVTPDRDRILCVGNLLPSKERLHASPLKSPSEKRIVVYNLGAKVVESQIPVLHDVRDITISRNGQHVLVSYQNKVPPQLWRVEKVKEGSSLHRVRVRLALVCTYILKDEVEFTEASYFGGPCDELVFCTIKGGEILLWHRESAILLHAFNAHNHGIDLTGIAWNKASPTLMLATAAHDDTVKIWGSTSYMSTEIESHGAPSSQVRGTTTDRSSLIMGARSEVAQSHLQREYLSVQPPPEVSDTPFGSHRASLQVEESRAEDSRRDTPTSQDILDISRPVTPNDHTQTPVG